jgi:hypothetical protein
MALLSYFVSGFYGANSLPECPFWIDVQQIQELRQPGMSAMEVPSFTSVIFSIEQPYAEISVILEQSDINDSAISIDVTRTAWTLYEIAAHDRAHAWHNIPVSLARLKCALDTFPIKIVRMREAPQGYLFQNRHHHPVNLTLKRFSII